MSSALRFSSESSVPVVPMSSEQLVCSLRDRIFTILDSLQRPIRILVASNCVSKTKFNGK
jgi:hypothetical protein